jgi:hypothetical protein
MKALLNLMTVVSFVGVVGIIGGGAYVYSQKDALIEQAKEAAMEEITAALPDLLSGSLGGDAAGLVPDGIGSASSGTGSTSIVPVPSAPLGLGF